MTSYKGKAIYQPDGKAGEYAKWACNLYVGCSNGCQYCYLRKGRGASILGGKTAELKKCFKDGSHALEIFERELQANLPELQKHGIFFSFTTDPMLLETLDLTIDAVSVCQRNDVPAKILTKCTGYLYCLTGEGWNRNKVALGLTLTGHDELEPGASSNDERIEAMRLLHKAGFKTFASIEPIIDFRSARRVILASLEYCDLYKVGLMSGKKYDVVEAQSFVEWLNELEQPKIYLKESLQKLTRYRNEDLDDYFVGADYNLFTN